MAGTYPPLPPREDLLALARAAWSNARDLLGEAQLLADVGSFPRAFALATLAWEEVSKGTLCLLAVVLPEITADYFWENFRDHEGKLRRVLAFAAFMQCDPVGAVGEFGKKVVGQSKSTDKLKERGLYVDYRRGKILLPSEIGERAARKQIKAVREVLAFTDSAFSIDSLGDQLTQANAVFDGIKNAMVADPDATAEAFQNALRGGSQAELQALALRHVTIPDDPVP
jgi:AbiV family abortive infection protein